MTDAEGQFFVPLTAGTWRLTAEAHGYRPASVQVQVKAGRIVTQDLVLHARG